MINVKFIFINIIIIDIAVTVTSNYQEFYSIIIIIIIQFFIQSLLI